MQLLIWGESPQDDIVTNWTRTSRDRAPRLLVVDDDMVHRHLLRHYLEGWGYKVEVAECGDAALTALADGRASSFDAMITDLHMPGIDGLSLTRLVRERVRGAHFPILLVSADDEPQFLIDCLEAGADDYVTKPVFPGELHARVRAALRMREMDMMLRHAKRQLERDLEAAQALQQAMLPARYIEMPSLDVAWEFIPSSYVAGDFFDCYTLEDGRQVFYVADSVGHGAASAMFGFFVHQLLRSNAQMPLGDPAALCEALDALIIEQSFDRYLTMFYAVYDPSDRSLLYCNAGHPMPFLLRDGCVTQKPWRSGGTPVGMGLGLVYENARFQCRAGDRLIVYSDGLSEAQDPEGVEIKEAHVIETLSQVYSDQLDQQLARLIGVVHEWCQHDVLDDDLTLMGVRFR